MQPNTDHQPSSDAYQIRAWRVRLTTIVSLGAFACLMLALALGVWIALWAIVGVAGPA